MFIARVIKIPLLFFLSTDNVLMLQRFLKLCRKPIIECSDATPVITSDNIVRKSYRKHTDGGINFHIDAFILPDDMKWPTFLAATQRRSFFKNIYFRRQNKVDINRRKYSIDILRNKSRVVWCGSPGIGKSCDINYIFIELLSHLGQDSWPREVAFRTGINLYTFTSNEVTRTEISHSNLVKYSTDKRGYSVLILELYDDEYIPRVRMPFLSAVSSRDLYGRYTTAASASDLNTMWVSPPDLEEVCLMTEAIMELCPKDNVFNGSTKEEALNIVRSRALKVGAIPRYLFCNENIFASRLLGMKNALRWLPHDLGSLTINNIHSSVQCFVAPFFREGVTEPNFYLMYKDAAPELFTSVSNENNVDEKEFMNSVGSIEFRYVSDYAKQLHSSWRQSIKDIGVLKRNGYNHNSWQENP